MMTTRDHRGLLLFCLVCLLWGVPYLFIGIALRDGATPLVVAAVRVALAAVLLLAIGSLSACRSLLVTHPVRIAVLAMVEIAVPFSLISIGEVTVTSGVTGVLIATEPLFILAIGLWVAGRSRLSPVAVAGAFVGFGGLVVMFGVDGAGSGTPLVVAAAASYAIGAVLVDRWFTSHDPKTVVTCALIVATPALTVVALVVEPMPLDLGLRGLGALLALGLVCTPIGFWAFFALIHLEGPARAALVTYIAPIIALASGAAILGEPITPRTLIGTALVLAGAALAYRRPAVGDG